MKRSVILFLCLATLMLLVAPMANLWLDRSGGMTNHVGGEAPTAGETPWWHLAHRYRLDFLMPWLGRLAYPFGISISPEQVVIGRDDWLYLGDKYASVISRKRSPASAEDLASIDRIDAATQAWRQWFKTQGVRLYRIQLVPDKSSVYPEFLPGWVRPVADHATNRLRQRVSPAIYADNRPALLNAKKDFNEPLYYRTDSHWSSAGAWVGYRDLAETINADGVTEIRWLAPEQISLTMLKNQPGRDLANFLWMLDMLRDIYVRLVIDSGQPQQSEIVYFETGKQAEPSDHPQAGAPRRPLLVRSLNALNQARLLWFRDSFGNAMAPLMAATFSETLQMNYGLHNPEQIARLVSDFKPDYVIVTAIERASLSHWFQQPPPVEPARLNPE